MISYFRAIGMSAWSLWKGLWVTLRAMLSPIITVQYPAEKLTLPEGYRGALAFHPDLCISCEMCVRACPSACIALESKRNEATSKKDLVWFRVDFAKCNHCRLCEEACPTKPKSIHHTRHYELTFTDRSEFVMEWRPETPQPKDGETGQVWSRYVAGPSR